MRAIEPRAISQFPAPILLQNYLQPALALVIVGSSRWQPEPQPPVPPSNTFAQLLRGLLLDESAHMRTCPHMCPPHPLCTRSTRPTSHGACRLRTASPCSPSWVRHVLPVERAALCPHALLTRTACPALPCPAYPLAAHQHHACPARAGQGAAASLCAWVMSSSHPPPFALTLGLTTFHYDNRDIL